MRRLLSGIAWLVQLASLLVTLPAAWVAATVTSEDGWADFSSSWATDPQIETAAVDAIAGAITPQGTPDFAETAVQLAVRQAAKGAVGDPGWTRAWEQSQRRSHRLTLDESSDGRVVIDLAPVADYVVDRLAGGLPISIATPQTLLVRGDAEPQPEALERVRDAPQVATVGAIVALASALVLLLTARRRGRALAAAGVAAIVVAVVGAFVGLGVGAVEPTSGTAFSRTYAQVALDDAATSFLRWCLVTGIVGVVAGVAGVSASALAGGRRTAAP